MTKYTLILIFAATMLFGCKNPHAVEFDISTPGLSAGVVMIKGDAEFGENIKNGKCIIKGMIDHPDFYQLQLLKDGDKRAHRSIEIYLDPTKYTITTQGRNLDKYPIIITDSKFQNEISAYHHILDDTQQEYKNGKSKDDKDYDPSPLAALSKFVKKYPDSELAAHFMAEQNLKKDPRAYAALFEQMSADAKNSRDGKDVQATLNTVIKLLSGQKAPAIDGKVFDGRPFADIIKGKKVFLIDFWKAGYNVSHDNQTQLAMVFNKYQAKGFQIISVALNNRELWWKSAVKTDKWPWPQMSDLKGDDSPNVTNWDISTTPTYYILDKDWKIIVGDVPKASIEAYVSEYLDKHP